MSTCLPGSWRSVHVRVNGRHALDANITCYEEVCRASSTSWGYYAPYKTHCMCVFQCAIQMQVARVPGVPCSEGDLQRLAVAMFRGVLRALPASACAWFGSLRDRTLAAQVEVRVTPPIVWCELHQKPGHFYSVSEAHRTSRDNMLPHHLNLLCLCCCRECAMSWQLYSSVYKDAVFRRTGGAHGLCRPGV